MSYKYNFYFQTYKIFNYEILLAKKEIEAFFGLKQHEEIKGGLSFQSDKKLDLNKLKRLTFFKKIVEYKGKDEVEIFPEQVYHENSAKAVINENTLITRINKASILSLNGRKESKYTLHGIHDYKGKFYPQLVRSLINIYMPDKPGVILDPFCGSSTSILEASLLGNRAVGIDIHPLAPLIGNVKVSSVTWSPDQFREFVTGFTTIVRDYAEDNDYSEFYKGDIEYLSNWYNKKILNKLFFIYNRIESVKETRYKNFLLIIFSSLLRDCSHQDPKQIRIYRRKELLENYPVIEEFLQKLLEQSNKLISFLYINEDKPNKESVVLTYDSRKLLSLKDKYFANGIDLVVTSPPYATALPYIDTDRLSLFFLNLIKKKERKSLEYEMVGNREITNSMRADYERKLLKNDENLPKDIHQLIMKIKRMNNKSEVGFRKLNTAALLYKYFADMKIIMKNIFLLLNKKGNFLIVIGNNYTNAGEDRVDIFTDRLLESIATQIGYIVKTPIDITVTAQNLAHMKNFIKENQVLVLEKR